MKLRVRSVNGGDTHRVYLSENDASLQALKEAIALKLNFPGSKIDLSLNKRDALQGLPEEPLQSFGITAGDLVFYSLDRHDFQNNTIPDAAKNPETRKTATGKELKNPNEENPKNASGKALTMRELCASAAMKRAFSDSSSSSRQPVEIAVDNEKEQCGAEPTEEDNEILEKSRSIPYFLEKVLLEEGENAKGEHGFLIIAVHAVMLELGFLVFNEKVPEASLGIRLPHGWATKALVSLHYTLPELVFVNGNLKQVEYAELKFSVMGKFLIVYGGLGSAKGSQHCRLGLDVGKYFPSILLARRLIGNSKVGETLETKHEIPEGHGFLGDERVFFELWKVLKDGLCVRVYTALCENVGLPLPPSLIMLPTELKMLILQGLPAVDIARMGCVCTEFRFLASNDELWKQKYLDELGSCRTRSVQRWKDAFARIWMERKRADLRRRRTGDGPVWQPLRPLLRRFPFTYGVPGYGTVGGDFDRFPAIGGGTLFEGGGMGGRLGLGGGSLGGGLPFRRSMMPGCDLNGFGGDIDAEADPDFQLGRV